MLNNAFVMENLPNLQFLVKSVVSSANGKITGKTLWAHTVIPSTNAFEYLAGWIAKQTITENIYCLLHNYLTCSDINTVLFTYGWHGARKEIYENVIEKLTRDNINFAETIIILKCSKEENIKRAVNDGRDKERIKRGIEMTFSFYDEYDYPVINTTDMTPSQVIDKIKDIMNLDMEN